MRTKGNQRRWKILGLVLHLTGTLLMGSSATAGDARTKVKASAAAGKIDADGKQTVTIALIIAKGYHIYANPVKNEDFESLQTVVKIRAGTKPARADVKYPAGKVFQAYGITYIYYDERVDIKAVLQRTPGDDSPLEIEVWFSARDDVGCLPPATIRLSPK